MNLKQAKKLRKEVYGNTSLRIARVYDDMGDGARVNHASSPRAKYQAAKKAR